MMEISPFFIDISDEQLYNKSNKIFSTYASSKRKCQHHA